MSGRNLRTERLESRVLMSAFSTVDSFELSPGHSSGTQTMAADAAGNVYAVGSAANSAGIDVGVVREKPVGGSTWNTVDLFSYVAGQTTTFYGAAVGPDGTLYVSGQGTDSTGRTHWLTLARASGALTTIDDFVTSGGAGADQLAIDGSGDIFVAGNATYVTRKSTTYNWIVRRRLAGQTSFATVDNLTASGSGAGAIGVTTITAGAGAGVYVVGDEAAPNGSGNWIVRKSSDGGSSWATVDNFQLTAGVGSNLAEAVTADGAGNIYVAGLGSAPSNLMFHWIVRKSSDGGATWTTDDNYQLAATKNAVASGIGVDAIGDVYVAGYAVDSSSVRHAILRTNAGGTWNTADDFTMGQFAGYRGFASDAAGNLYVGGSDTDVSGTGQWIVRAASGSAAPATPAAAFTFSTTPITSSTDGRHHHARFREPLRQGLGSSELLWAR